MKHIKLFEGWGDPINRKSSKFILIQKNHYLSQEKKIGYYKTMEESIPDFLHHFKNFINYEWEGIPKDYFLEWNYDDIEGIDSWDEFFLQAPKIDETTFYLEDFDPSRDTKIFYEVDLLEIVYRKDPTYLQNFLPFQ